MKLLAQRHTVQGLLTYYISLYGFVGMCIVNAQATEAWKLAGFGLTLLAILVQDVDWYRKSRVHPHDLALTDRLTGYLEAHGLDKLFANHDFEQQGYGDRELDALRELRDDWQGVEYQFVNTSCQATWAVLRRRLAELITLLEDHASLRGANFYHLLAGNAEPGAASEGEHRARAANQLARELHEDFQALRGAYLAMQRVRG